jgi:hypothetical protein
MVHNCVVQTPVKAIGKKCNTTFFPLKSANETSFNADENNVNRGAGEPDCNDIVDFLYKEIIIK